MRKYHGEQACYVSFGSVTSLTPITAFNGITPALQWTLHSCIHFLRYTRILSSGVSPVPTKYAKYERLVVEEQEQAYSP